MRHEGTHFILAVRNTGVPFPSGLDFRNTESLGLQLVNVLTRQLGGTLGLDQTDGTLFTIAFPAEDQAPPP